MPPSIKDVAKKARVSTATVSLVVHNHERISAATRKRVLKAIADLNYRPSRNARRLVTKKTRNIGFLLTNDHFLRTEPFYTHIFLGTEFEARDHEYYVLLNTISEHFQERDKLPRFVLENTVDGIIIAGKIPDNIVPNLEVFQIPLVFVDYYPPNNNKYPKVLIDNVNGGIDATQHLIDHGHRKIGFIGGDINHPSIRDRLQGYKIALKKAGIKFNDRYLYATETSTNRSSGYHAAQELLNKDADITALFACNDAMAIGAMQCFKENGFSIPKDISIIGFDDVTADLYTDPRLSSMNVPKVELGIQATRMIIDMMDKNVNGSKQVLVPVQIVARDSVTEISG